MANIRYPAKIHKNSELVNVGDPVDFLKYTKKVNNPSQIDLVSSWKTDDSFGKPWEIWEACKKRTEIQRKQEHAGKFACHISVLCSAIYMVFTLIFFLPIPMVESPWILHMARAA